MINKVFLKRNVRTLLLGCVKKKRFHKWLPLLLVFFSCEAKAKTSKPNIIVILTDDLGIGDLQAYRKLYAGGDDVWSPTPTPNLDKLASEGVTCTRAYATAWCAPSRQSLLSGLYSNRPSAYSQSWFGNRFRKLNYKTGFIGKSHGEEAGKKTIKTIGKETAEFDMWFGFNTGMRTFYISPNESKNIQITKRNGMVLATVASDTTGHLTDIFTREAANFIKQNKDNPFFLYVAYNAPHTPLEGKPEDLRKLFPGIFASMSDAEIKATAPGNNGKYKKEHFQALVYGVDRGVGVIINSLKDCGIDQNTVVFFMSDNGSEVGTNYPLSGKKHDVLEGGIRIPFIVWSNQLKTSPASGKHYDGLVSVCDVAPTCLALADEIKTNTPTDGTNIMPYLLDITKVLKNRDYYYADLQQHQFGTKSKDVYPVNSLKEKTTVIQVFVHDTVKQIYYQAHKTTDPRTLYFSLPDVKGQENPNVLLSESYDFEEYRKSNANEKQKATVKKRFNAFMKANKEDLTEEWSGEYVKNR